MPTNLPVTFELLQRALPTARTSLLQSFAAVIEPACVEFSINTSLRKAHFLAQVTHECGDFTMLKESLYYSKAERIEAIFGKYFEDEDPEEYTRNPEKLGNWVYANRMGNGDVASGDGYRYCGRGPIQITGKDMYLKVGNALGVDLIKDPDRLLVPTVGMRASGFFWNVEKNLNPIADTDDVMKVTKRVNGGYNGLDDRKLRLTAFKKAFGLI